MIQLIMGWYDKLWPNLVAAPIVAAATWILHRITFQRSAVKRHNELLDKISEKNDKST